MSRNNGRLGGCPWPMLTFVVPGERTHGEGGASHHVGVMPTIKLCIYREAVRLQGNVEIDPRDPQALTHAEVQGLRGALEHLQYLRETIPGFENVLVVGHSHLGVHETRRIVGDHMLTIDEVTNQVCFDDVVALSCRGLDYHLAGTVLKWFSVPGHHDVPLAALLPQGVENLVVAGRSISCDHLSQASLRPAGTCLATGHAAGRAAALAAGLDSTLRALDIRLVQRTLIEQDAILGVGERAELFAGRGEADGKVGPQLLWGEHWKGSVTHARIRWATGQSAVAHEPLPFARDR